MIQSPNMHPDIAQFLTKAWPKDGGTHTLALGELHSIDDHVKWLQQHLSTLQHAHNLTTIGLEDAAHKNIFLWAYQDGTLERSLGSKRAAREYFMQAMIADISPEFQQSQQEIISLTIEAIDAGIRVVAHDGRESFQDLMGTAASKPDAELANGQPNRNSLATNEAHQKKIRAETSNYAANWVVSEINWLIGQNPNYKARFDAIERLVEVGHRKIKAGKLTSDGLSAVLFNALATPSGNHLAISGVAHISGVNFYSKDPIDGFNGSFHHHLFAARQSAEAHRSHRVTCGVIATTAGINRMKQVLQQEELSSSRPVIQNSSIPTINILPEATQPIGEIRLNPKASVPLETVFLPEPSKRVQRRLLSDAPSARATHYQALRQKRAAAHINPLLIPEIKDAANVVRELMNPELCGQSRA